MADIELTAPDGHRFAAYRADPDRPPNGGVVVIQEIFGVTAHIRAVADRFAAEGFVALAPSLFDRIERGAAFGYDPDGIARARTLAWEELPLDAAVGDVSATVAALSTELGGPGRVGTVGFCYGGMLSAAVASRSPEDLGAAVAYYPSQAADLLTDDVPSVPLLVHLGDRDQRVTPEDGRTLEARWPTAEFHHYDAGHGFHCDERPDHAPDAAEHAWQRTVAFLDAHLGHPTGAGGAR